MNWLKVAAVAIGALIAFFIVSSVVGVILHLVGYILIAALLAGGGYVAYKIASSGKGREVRGRRRDRELRDDGPQEGYTPPPPQQQQPSRPNVDDELNRLKRDMGR